MKRALPLLFIASLLPYSQARAALYVTVVQGLGGDDHWQARFSDQQEKITEASITMAGEAHVKSFTGDDATRDNLMAHFRMLSTSMNDDDRLALYLIGHGSYDGEQYKFNIPGPDITDGDLAEILGTLPGRNHFVVNTSSASGAMLDKVETDDRILVTATRNGNEKNATEFGDFFAAALTSDSADINKNNSISIQEAFDYAERQVASFFENQSKLATEHPQIRGDNAASFNLARVNVAETPDEDPRITQLLSQREALDAQIEELQLNRGRYTNAEYIQKLQALILESAEVGEQIDNLREGSESR
jgi:hypothetical protein